MTGFLCDLLFLCASALGLDRVKGLDMTFFFEVLIGGLLAGLVTTLFVVPCLYTLVVRDRKQVGMAPKVVTPAG